MMTDQQQITSVEDLAKIQADVAPELVRGCTVCSYTCAKTASQNATPPAGQ